MADDRKMVLNAEETSVLLEGLMVGRAHHRVGADLARQQGMNGEAAEHEHKAEQFGTLIAEAQKIERVTVRYLDGMALPR